MDGKFISERITKLRLKKNVSEYKMSYDLGHSSGYVRAITSGRAMPSMGEFLYMCEYLGVTPAEFFSEEIADPVALKDFASEAKELSDEDLTIILELVKRLKKK